MRRLLLVPTLLALALLAPTASAGTITIQPVKTGLDFPAAFTFAPGGKIVYAERFSGEIRIFDPVANTDTLGFTVPNVATAGEQGLLGLALHPQFTSGQPFLYAYATQNVSGTPRNRILRIRYRPGQPATSSVIFTSNVNAQSIHNGGRILFGPDGKLYVFIGEASNPANSQDITSNTAGKILRINPNGTVPGDNPFPGEPIFSYGHRNSFGFTFDSQTGQLWETENGPSCNDELNRPEAGKNYGWGPTQTCSGTDPQNTNHDGPMPVLPLLFYTPTTAPTGAVFCTSCGLSGSEGHLFFGENNTGRIREIVLTANRLGVASQSIAVTHVRAVYSMERGPDGVIYFSDDRGVYKLV
jgi:glucose/arabinose dehydrogenase